MCSFDEGGDPYQQAWIMRNTYNATIFAVGLGPKQNNSALARLTGDPGKVYNTSNFMNIVTRINNYLRNNATCHNISMFTIY